MADVFCGSLICRLLEKETGITWKWSVGEESNLAREVQLKKAVIPPLVGTPNWFAGSVGIFF